MNVSIIVQTQTNINAVHTATITLGNHSVSVDDDIVLRSRNDKVRHRLDNKQSAGQTTSSVYNGN